MMYQLVFKGECAKGVDEATARANAKALFKASDDQIQKMFSGGRVVIRNKLDGQTAQKYQGVMKQKGIICHIEPMPGQEEASEPQPAPAQAQAQAQAQPQPQPTEPAGSGVQTEPGDRLPVAGEKVDSILAETDLSLGKPGEQLGTTREEEPPEFEHLDDWTVAPPGEDLVEEHEEPAVPMPDVSHLSLADEPKEG